MKTKRSTSIKSSFRLIEAMIVLLLIFLLVQGAVQWKVCRKGTEATQELLQQGLPGLRLLAELQDNLAAYRLHSYELIFAMDKDRAAKGAETDAVQQKSLKLLEEMKQLYAGREGAAHVATLETNFNDYVQTVNRVRGLIQKDFTEAMKVMDQEVPGKVTALAAAASRIKEHNTEAANRTVGFTVSSFEEISKYTRWFGAASVGFAAITLILVVFNSTRVSRALNKLVDVLTNSSVRVSQAAGQMTDSSQSLAEGSNAQAASVEETSASLEELSSMTQRNAESAQQANDLARHARSAADKGAGDMAAMNTAMQAIKASSEDIAKIIKTIDEIAFQTNILALNAAVEAARAGDAGMGFAVVADEVRNLAQRSAQAAKETAAKIEGAINNTTQGVQISSKVTAALNDIVLKARQVDELAAEVAGATREQTQGITQINAAVGQMDKVTQSNASNAEESAAAAQELNAQAAVMKEAVDELLQLVGSQARTQEKSQPNSKSQKPPLINKVAKLQPADHYSNGQNDHVHAHPAAPVVAEARRGEIPRVTTLKNF